MPVGDEVVCGLTLVYLPSLEAVSMVQQVGIADVEQSLRVTELCVEGCMRMHERLKTFLLEEN